MVRPNQTRGGRCCLHALSVHYYAFSILSLLLFVPGYVGRGVLEDMIGAVRASGTRTA